MAKKAKKEEKRKRKLEVKTPDASLKPNESAPQSAPE
jgi:hypothetical protein